MTTFKKILVTGGTGFIGRPAVIALLARGFEVHIVSRGDNQQIPGVIFHRADLLNPDACRELINSIQPQYLLHAAWYAEHGKYWEAIENVFWLRATISLIEAFADGGGLRAVGVGTCAEYDWSYGVAVEGATPENPSTLYGKCKLAAGVAFGAVGRERKISSAWARVFFPFGPCEPSTRLVPTIVQNLLRDKPATCMHGQQFRDFLFVVDAGEALAALVDSEVTGVVNIGSGEPIRIGEIAGRLGDILGRPNLLSQGAVVDSGNSPMMLVASTCRLNEEVGWHPKHTLEEGLQTSVCWWRERFSTLS